MEAVIRDRLEQYIDCPHCGEEYSHRVDHITEGQSFGLWYCHTCGKGFSGWRKDGKIELSFANCGPNFIPSYVLLCHEAANLYIIIRANHLIGGDNAYFYNEHTCPTNYLGVEQAFVYSGIDESTDQHGLFTYIGSIPAQGNESRISECSGTHELLMLFAKPDN